MAHYEGTNNASAPFIVDHFAGGGGASTGIELALGIAPAVAINHSPAAIAIHAANHPQTRHLIDDIWRVDPRETVAGRRVDLMWTSPSCTHFSGAKGGTPLSKQLRALPWTAPRWAAAVKPSVIIVENVGEMQTWGPLTPEGRPNAALKGRDFRRWVKRLIDLGYDVEWKTLDAADFGAPTHRERLFVIARCDGKPIAWPTPTHGPGRPQPWVGSGSVINWRNLGEPIEGRQRQLAEHTKARIARELDAHGSIVPQIGGIAALYTYQYGGQGRAVDRPSRTLTTGDRMALATRAADGVTRFRSLEVAELGAIMGFPSGYVYGKTRKEACAMIGNSVSPMVARAVVAAQGVGQ